MPNEDFADFASFFNDKVKAHGLTLEKISEQSGIDLNHLENLSRGHYEDMPPAPYFRGYLAKLGTLLDFDPSPWWERFMALGMIKKSGPLDQLPQNRFAKVSRVRYIFLSAAGVLVVGYLGFNLSHIIGQPQLSVDCPKNTTKENQVLVSGKISNAEHLDILGETIQAEADGSWFKYVPLSPGPNTIVITAKKFLGREVQKTCQVVFEQETSPTQNPPVNSSPSPTATSSNP